MQQLITQLKAPAQQQEEHTLFKVRRSQFASYTYDFGFAVHFAAAAAVRGICDASSVYVIHQQAQLLQQLAIASKATANSAAINQQVALAACSSADSEQRVPALNAQWLQRVMSEESGGAASSGSTSSTLFYGGLLSTAEKLSLLQRSDSIAVPSPASASAFDSAFGLTGATGQLMPQFLKSQRDDSILLMRAPMDMEQEALRKWPRS